MKKMHSGSENLHLLSDCSDLVSAFGEEFSDTSKLLCAVLDVPNLIVEMPTHTVIIT